MPFNFAAVAASSLPNGLAISEKSSLTLFFFAGGLALSKQVSLALSSVTPVHSDAAVAVWEYKRTDKNNRENLT
jgi:hypothetical protein